MFTAKNLPVVEKCEVVQFFPGFSWFISAEFSPLFVEARSVDCCYREWGVILLTKSDPVSVKDNSAKLLVEAPYFSFTYRDPNARYCY